MLLMVSAHVRAESVNMATAESQATRCAVYRQVEGRPAGPGILAQVVTGRGGAGVIVKVV